MTQCVKVCEWPCVEQFKCLHMLGAMRSPSVMTVVNCSEEGERTYRIRKVHVEPPKVNQDEETETWYQT